MTFFQDRESISSVHFLLIIPLTNDLFLTRRCKGFPKQVKRTVLSNVSRVCPMDFSQEDISKTLRLHLQVNKPSSKAAQSTLFDVEDLLLRETPNTLWKKPISADCICDLIYLCSTRLNDKSSASLSHSGLFSFWKTSSASLSLQTTLPTLVNKTLRCLSSITWGSISSPELAPNENHSLRLD